MTAWLELGRQTFRQLMRHPLYSIFAMLTLAIAIGGGALIFSLYDAIALRSLPVDRPGQLVSVRKVTIDSEGRTANFGRLSLEELETMRDAAAPLAEVGAWASGEAILRVANRTERDEMQWVDPRFFDILGVSAVRGRTFEPSDDIRKGGAGGVLLSEATWARLFDRDPRIVGTSLDVDGAPRPILGIAPAGFHGFEVGADPALFGIASEAPDNWAFFRMFARLHPGTGPEQLEAKLEGVLEALRAGEPGRKTFMIVDGKSSESTERIQVVDGSRGESELRGDAMLPLALVGALLVLVLFVLAANLANLLAVRAISERGPAAIRLALGAPRTVIVGGWFAESFTLALSGTVIGLVLVARFGKGLLTLAPLPRWAHGLTPAVDLPTIGVALVLALAVAVLVGSLAAFEQRRVAPTIQLREASGTTTEARSGVRWRNALIASQVALSVVLLVAMGLFVRSANALLRIDTGFPLERVATFRIDLPVSLTEQASIRIDELRREIARMPGVADAGFSSNPVLGGVSGYVMGAVEGYHPEDDEVMMLNTLEVSPGFFGALEMPLASGRAPDDSAVQGRTRSVVVNRRFVEKYFGGREPLGRRLSFNFMRNWAEDQPDDLTIVGVVDDRMISDVREAPTPRIYPTWTEGSSVTYYVRTPGNPRALAPAIVKLARERIPDAALGAFTTLEDQRDHSLRSELTTMNLTLLFGLLAATLAALGLFAVVSYVVGERRREFALRQALGAKPGDLLRQVILDGLRPVAWGLAVGLVAAVGLARFATSQLYGVAPSDPVAFIGATVLMILVALGACLPAAVRASRIDPSRALRAE